MEANLRVLDARGAAFRRTTKKKDNLGEVCYVFLLGHASDEYTKDDWFFFNLFRHKE